MPISFHASTPIPSISSAYAASLPPNQSANLTQQDGTGSGWVEQTSKDGRKYFYNTKTGRSQWDKPDAMKTPAEVALNATGWKEYATADGRKYWFHKETKVSTWQEPDEVRVIREAASSNAEEEWPKFQDLEKAKQHFKLLLDAKKFPHKITWEAALKILEQDKRLESLVILTKGSKKQIFSEHMTHVARQQQNEERKRRELAREKILAELKNCSRLTPGTKFSQFAEWHHGNPWWAWLSEREKDDIYQDFMDDFEERWKSRRKKNIAENMEKLIALMDSHPSVKPTTKWAEARAILENTKEWENLDLSYCLEAWQRHCSHENKKHAEQIRKQKYRQERKKRDAFVDFLKECVDTGRIHAETQWNEFLLTIVKDNRYRNLVGVSGSTPRELFLDVVDNLKEEIKVHYQNIKDALQQRNFVIDANTTYQDFFSAIGNLGRTIKSHILVRFFENVQENIRNENSKAQAQKIAADLVENVPETKKRSFDDFLPWAKEHLPDKFQRFDQLSNSNLNILREEFDKMAREKETLDGRKGSESATGSAVSRMRSRASSPNSRDQRPDSSEGELSSISRKSFEHDSKKIKKKKIT